MPSLLELQAQMRHALKSGDSSALVALLAGGSDPAQRFAIHHRHVEASLARALVRKFPAAAWLVGSDFVAGAARAFAREQPPTRPCIAEYGEDFPAFLGTCDATGAVPYLRDFATLEWHVAQAAVDVGGARYMCASWGVDELMHLFLTDTSPEEFALKHETVWLEIVGNRGDVQINRLAGKEDYERRVARRR